MVIGDHEVAAGLREQARRRVELGVDGWSTAAREPRRSCPGEDGKRSGPVDTVHDVAREFRHVQVPGCVEDHVFGHTERGSRCRSPGGACDRRNVRPLTEGEKVRTRVGTRQARRQDMELPFLLRGTRERRYHYNPRVAGYAASRCGAADRPIPVS